MSGGEQLWFGGLPVTGTRALSDAELAELESRIAAIRRSAGLNALAAIASLGVVAAIVFLSTTLPFVALLAIIALRLLRKRLPPIALTLPRRLRALRRDAQARVVSICSADDVTSEVLPQSQLVWRVRGAAPERPIFYTRSTTAPTPERAAAAANFVRPVDERFFTHQRALTIAEREELAGYAPRPLLPALLLPVVAAAGAVLAFWRTPDDVITPVAFAVLAFWTGRSAYRQWRNWRRFAPDVAHGVVLIVRMQDDGELTPPEEYLPSSRFLWTHAGVPALWRRTRRVV
jgi:hypothetical protein